MQNKSLALTIAIMCGMTTFVSVLCAVDFALAKGFGAGFALGFGAGITVVLGLSALIIAMPDSRN